MVSLYRPMMKYIDKAVKSGEAVNFILQFSAKLQESNSLT